MQPFASAPIYVKTTARLHMGFIDLHGGLGRRFGSIGLSLEAPATAAIIRPAQEFEAHGPGAERTLVYARRVMEGLGLKTGVAIQVLEAIPEHAGLGSGTQCALAVGMAVAQACGQPLTVREAAALVQRGKRSGIGIAAFEQGGFLVDGGVGLSAETPPLLARMAFPLHWDVFLVMDPALSGVHGEQETRAFVELPCFPANAAAAIARLVLMRVLPGVAEQDLDAFGAGIREIQQMLGAHFAPAQGGTMYTSPRVARVMACLESQGVKCVGQSSWGPTGFAILGAGEESARLAEAARAIEPGLEYRICKARNQGSVVRQANAADLAVLA